MRVPCVVSVFAFLVLSGCTGSVDPYEGIYRYRAYDHTGGVVVTGLLEFREKSQEGVKGVWQLEAVNGAGNTGINNSFGHFEGFLKGDAIYLDLHPGWIDNNVILTGVMNSESFSGEWAYIGFPGVINQGKFDATLD
jgi:hypothetical protein